MNKNLFSVLTLALLGILNAQLFTAFAQGSLTPPGAPAPLFKTLDQVEPRTAITNLPINITQGGSYYLTKSFVQNFANDAITIATNNVALDFCGFTIRQTVGSNSAGGIRIASTFNTPTMQVSVRNGFITGFTNSAGLLLRGTRNCVFENLVVTECGAGFNFQANGTAPYVGNILRHCLTSDNSGSGIVFIAGAANSENVIEQCDSLNNGSAGFAMSVAGNLIIGSRASGNVNNYVIAAGNRMGLIVLPGTNTVSISGSTSTTGTGTTDPFANLSY